MIQPSAVVVAGLSTRVRGPRTAPTIVLLHGGGLSGWTWDPVVEHLARDFQCLVPDLPEHGQSARTGPFSILDAANRVAILIQREAHDGQATVVGHSLGGQIALTLLAIAPGQVERGILSGVLGRPVPGRRLLAPLLRMYFPWRAFPPLVRANMRAFGVPEQFFTRFRQDTRQMTLDALTRVFEENFSFRVPDGLARATAPTLAVVGEREAPVLRRSACDIVAALAHAEGRVVASASHNWMLTAPERFADMVARWTTGQPLPDWLLPLPC